MSTAKRSSESSNSQKARFVAVPRVATDSIVIGLGNAAALPLVRSGENSGASSIFSVVQSDGRIVISIQSWLQALSRRIGISIAESTVVQYGGTLSYLVRWLECAKPYPSLTIDESIESLSRSDLVGWFHFMKGAGAKSNRTLTAREACIKEFMIWLETIDGGGGRSPENSPWGRDRELKNIISAPSAASPKYLPTDIIVQALLGMNNECERCMFHAQYDTGLRIAELVGLVRADLPDETNYDPSHEFIPLAVSGVKGRAGGSKERITLISRAVLKRIKRYHNSSAYRSSALWAFDDPQKPVFLTANGLKWSTRNASKQFKTAVRRVDDTFKLRPHWLRHGTAFSVLRSDIGKDYQDRMLVVKGMLGHAHLSTTQIYTQISPAMLSKLTVEGKKLDRLAEAEEIRTRTFLAPLQHREKRGHR